MKETTTIILVILAVLALVIFVPQFVGAAQRAITVSSLQSACDQKQRALDKIISDTGGIEARQMQFSVKLVGQTTVMLEARQKNTQAREDKQTLELTCSLLKEALR